jgi:hypothetical protein
MGEDVGGIAVHIGARVAALAGAQRSIVSSTVKDLVAGSGLRLMSCFAKSACSPPGRDYAAFVGAARLAGVSFHVCRLLC